jgi:hypothetical protein
MPLATASSPVADLPTFRGLLNRGTNIVVVGTSVSVFPVKDWTHLRGDWISYATGNIK